MERLLIEQVPEVQNKIMVAEMKKLDNATSLYLTAYRMESHMFKRDVVGKNELLIQHKVNKCEISSAFLHANPGDYLFKMENDQFQRALQFRLLLDMRRDMKFCECGARLGPLLHHGYCCPLLSVRNKIRNSAHRSLAFGFRKMFADFINAKQLNSTILKSEPHLKDYFVLKDERINLQTVKTRGDITWSNDVNSIQ